MNELHQQAPRTYKRRGRVTTGQGLAFERAWPRWGVDLDAVVASGRPLDLSALFGHGGSTITSGERPVALEIGFGLGEVAEAMATAQPDVDLLAVDVHRPGLGALLRRIEEGGLTNVRVVDGDARVLLADGLPPGSLAAVRVFFPDPWPKKRHWKRRLVDAAFLDLVASRLAPGGVLHVATDWAAYAEEVAELLAVHPAFTVLDAPPWRPATRFEGIGEAAGRTATDVSGRRR